MRDETQAQIEHEIEIGSEFDAQYEEKIHFIRANSK